MSPMTIPYDPNDPASQAFEKAQKDKKAPGHDARAAQEASRIQTMLEVIREGYGNDRAADDIERSPDGHPTTPQKVVKGNA